jgi:SUKH-3 immunity protein of toxin-antitoxin system
MFTFKPEVEAALQECGWTPERRVPTEQWVQTLAQEGYTPFPLAVRILESFGGLTIRPVRNEQSRWAAETFTTDPVYIGAGEFDRVEDVQERYPLTFFPLAEYSWGMLLVADGGQVFGLYGDLLNCFGETFEEAVECLVLANTRSKPWGEARNGWVVPWSVAVRLGISQFPGASPGTSGDQRPSSAGAPLDSERHIFSVKPEVEAVLRECGWTPDRRVPTEQWNEPLLQKGLPCFPAALRILENFGGLIVDPPGRERPQFPLERMMFDPIFAAWGYLGWIAQLQERYRLRFFPVAENGNERMLLVSDCGRVFRLSGGSLFDCFGESLEEAVERLVLAHSPPERWGEKYTGWRVPETVAARLGISPEPDVTSGASL